MAFNLFLDTSGLFSFLIKNDDKHKDTSLIINKAINSGKHLITTDYIVDETATLLKSRGYSYIIPAFFDGIVSSKACHVEWMDQDLFDITKTFFIKFKDHEWSFTDCFSFVIMKNAGITEAITKDEHFREAGFTPLLQ